MLKAGDRQNKIMASIGDVQNKEKEIFSDVSILRDVDIFKAIAINFAPSIYFFCWLGYLNIKKVSFELPFYGFSGNRSTYNVYGKLSRVKVGGKTISLVKPLSSDYKPKLHNIEASKIKLSQIGRDLWENAYEEGLWDLVLGIPAAYCLKFEDFTQYFNSHIFFDREL
ncbi:hypothetical protein LCGC14_1642140, partial [marine sediment metagenome]